MSDNNQDRLLKAYNTLRETLKKVWEEAEEKAKPTLREALEIAEQKVSDLGEFSREEIEKVSDYLRRDIHEATEALAENGRELANWLEFDLELIETSLAETLADWVAKVADPTIVELERLREQAIIFGEWHTGEITGPGVLVCQKCGERLHFDKPGHIPPCPKCHGTVFKKEFTA